MSVGRRVRGLLEQSLEVAALTRCRVGTGGVFILGAPKTGTTDLGYALATNPEFWSNGDTNFFYSLIGSRPEGGSSLHDSFLVDRSNHEGPGDYRDFVAHFGKGLERMFQRQARGRRWIDSAYANVLFAEVLVSMFPTARFLHLVRDGRAVVRSGLDAGARWAPDARSAAQIWNHYAGSGLRLQQQFPERVMRVHAEQLMADPPGVTAKIHAFLDAEASDAPAECLQFYGLSRFHTKLTPNADGRYPAFDGPMDGGWDGWPAEDRAAFVEVAGELMRSLGYWPPAATTSRSVCSP